MTTKAPVRGETRKPKGDAQYQVKTPAIIGGVLLAPGETVFYDGLPGSNLIPLNATAKANAKKNKELRAAKYEGDTDEARYSAKQAALREADDELQGIGDFAEGQEDKFPDADPELLKHAEQTKEDTAEAAKDDPDVHGVKMSGEQTNTMRSTKDATPEDKNKPDVAKAK